MSQKIQTYAISAPGFLGLNTQDSPLNLSAGFALVANNCIIDQYGRIGSRKGWSRVNAAQGALAANDIGVLHELVEADGSLTIVFAGNNKLFKLNSSDVVTELTYGGGGVTPTITASKWQCASLNAITYFFQSLHDPLIFDPTVSTTTYRRVSEKSGYVATVPSGNIAISAYGRLWVANTSTNNNTVFFSDLLDGHVWATGTSGTLNVDRVWPNGADQITGLVGHNGFLVIFGKRQILIYANATTPATMSLSDSVGGIGCIARDTIQNTGKDILFLSNSGVRSVARTITEKSAPLGDFSKNVRNDLLASINGETIANINSVYAEKDGFYLLLLPLAKQVYCFDTKTQLEDGSFRVTIWDSIEPTSLLSRRNGDLYLGKKGYVGKYGTYLDFDSTYLFSYYTNHADLGDQSINSILKKVSVVVIGGSNQNVTIKWGFDFSSNYLSKSLSIPEQNFAEYGIDEYGSTATVLAYYSTGVSLLTLTSNASGSGKVVQTGYETTINNTQLSIQKIEIQAKNGKIN